MTLELELKCRSCTYKELIKVDPLKYHEWKQGALIQNCFPDLSKDTRGLMISKTCVTCFDKLFGESDNVKVL